MNHHKRLGREAPHQKPDRARKRPVIRPGSKENETKHYYASNALNIEINMVQGQILEDRFPVFVGIALAEHPVGKLCNSLRAHGRKGPKSHHNGEMGETYGRAVSAVKTISLTHFNSFAKVCSAQGSTIVTTTSFALHTQLIIHHRHFDQKDHQGIRYMGANIPV